MEEATVEGTAEADGPFTFALVSRRHDLASGLPFPDPARSRGDPRAGRGSQRYTGTGLFTSAYTLKNTFVSTNNQ